ncbi:MAG: trypsin-like peptidase domain-containing protein [Anaerolineaceae bacterium]
MIKNKIKLILLLMAVFVFGSACMLTNVARDAVTQLQQQPTAEPTQQEQITPLPSGGSTTIISPEFADLEGTLEGLYQAVNPGVVSIRVSSVTDEALGSGFVIDKQGHIVTNYHVVENAEKVEVDFPSGLKVYGNVIGTDLDSDLAVIKVDVAEEELTPLPLGDSDTALVGQVVVAIGNPYGLSGTMTLGIVSARGRVLDSLRQTASGVYFSAGDLIQTDTSINPGNSGGPLLNLKGEVIGVNRAIQTSGQTLSGEAANTGIGFAVSSNIVRRVVPSLIANGSYQYPYLGLSSLNSLNLTTVEALNLPQSTGAYVTDVVAGGPADRAGLRGGSTQTQISGLYGGGDLIVAVDGREIKDFSELLSYMVVNKAPGDVITFTVIRTGNRMELPVTLGERP